MRVTYPDKLKDNQPIVLALGLFDGIHAGHKAVLLKTRELAVKNNAQSAVATFCGNPHKTSLIDTYEERIDKLQKLGITYIIGIDFDSVSQINHNDFVAALLESYNIAAVVCGFDYRYGFDRMGNIDTLRQQLSACSIPLAVVEPVLFDGQKLSSTYIRELLAKGDTIKAGKLLGDNL